MDRDEPLFEISTDKVDTEIPSPAAGVLAEVLVKEGETVGINTVVRSRWRRPGWSGAGRRSVGRRAGPAEKRRPRLAAGCRLRTRAAPAPAPATAKRNATSCAADRRHWSGGWRGSTTSICRR